MHCKSLPYLFLVFFTISLSAQDSTWQVVIQGKVAEQLACEPEIQVVGFDLENSRQFESQTQVEAGQAFQLTISLPHEKEIMVSCADLTKHFLVSPGDTLELFIAGKQCSGLSVEMEGNDGIDLEPYQQLLRSDQRESRTMADIVQAISPEDYLQERALEVIKSDELAITPFMARWIDVNEKIRFGADVLRYMNFATILKVNFPSNVKQDFHRELNEVFDAVHWEGRASAEYYEFLNSYTAKVALDIDTNVQEILKEYGKRGLSKYLIDNIDQIQEQYPRNYMLSTYLCDLLDKGDFELAYIQKHLQKIENPYLKDFVTAKLNQFEINAAAKTDASQVRLHDFSSQNHEVSFLEHVKEKYPGQIIYLDVWATWCGSCIGKFPYTEKLKQRYDPSKFKVIYVGVSSKTKVWERVIKQHKISGDQYLLGEKDRADLQKVLGWQTIPHYAIINTEGELVDGDAPQPQYPELLEMLDQYLGK